MHKRLTVLTLALMLAGPVLADEPGSGYYAQNCSDPGGGYSITINRDGTALVDTDPDSYENVLTSYSFFGVDTPADFVIAIMFDEDNSPVPPYKGQSGWIEIWDSGESYYALENGRASREFKFCSGDYKQLASVNTTEFEGMYSYYADAALFTDCKDGKSYPVAAAGDAATLESRYLELQAGDNAKVWIRVKGKLIEQEGMEGDRMETAMLVNQFIDINKDKACAENDEPSLTGTHWQLIEVVRTGVPDDTDLARAELNFSTDGKLSGSNGCNRINGGYTLADGTLEFGPLMSTRRACPGNLGALERAVDQSLGTVNGFEISNGILHLWHDGVPVLRYKQG